MTCPGLARFVAVCVLAAALPRVHAQPVETGQVPYSRNGADTCLLCHIRWTTVSQIFDTKHGVPTDPRSPFGPGQLQCEACHGPGGLHAGGGAGGSRPAVIRFSDDSANSVAERNAQCLSCHDRDMGLDWHGGAHDNDQISCEDCHRVHLSADPVLARATQVEVCSACHGTVAAAANYPYAHPIRVGKMVCADCHAPHGAQNEAALVRSTVNETCYGCHAEKRGPFLWEHAPVAEDCSTCHSPHGSIHPGMLAQRPPFLCQTCHSQAGHPSVAQTPDGLASEPTPSAFLLAQGCLNCHSQVHGSNHPSGSHLMR